MPQLCFLKEGINRHDGIIMILAVQKALSVPCAAFNNQHGRSLQRHHNCSTADPADLSRCQLPRSIKILLEGGTWTCTANDGLAVISSQEILMSKRMVQFTPCCWAAVGIWLRRSMLSSVHSATGHQQARPVLRSIMYGMAFMPANWECKWCPDSCGLFIRHHDVIHMHA